MIRLFLVLLLCSSFSHAEIVQLEDYDEVLVNDEALSILKLETKIKDLEIEISDLKDRFEQLEYLQKKVLDIIGENESKTTSLFEQKTRESEYQYGYNQIIANNIDKAERAFDLYLEKYPNDSKIGEIYFWKGEIFYKRKDYTDALQNYLISYQKYPENTRSLDSLFKMSIVLGLLGKNKEACEGLALLVNNQINISESLRTKALSEAVGLGCINN